MVVSEIYPDLQSSYRQHHRTETAWLKDINDVLLKMNPQHVTLMVLLDLSAAFDTVDHDILLERLHVGKCSTLSAHICRIGASKCPSMGRFLDSSYLPVAYLRVLVWDPCCSSFF